jgi:hypothetical protein
MMNSKIIRKPIPDYTSDVSPNEEKRQNIIGPLKLAKKKVDAGLTGYAQINPEGLDELNAAYDKLCNKRSNLKLNYSDRVMEVLCSLMCNYKGSNESKETGDGYEWFAAQIFQYNEDSDGKFQGEIAVFFPYLGDKEEKEGTRMDRSINFYVHLKRNKVNMGNIEDLVKALIEKIS